MKTYLLDTFNKYKRYSDKLDAKTILCNRCWWVFNDLGEKETYIFREDGSIIITLSGAVTYGKWEYIAANQSVIIGGNNQSYMVHPTFIDGVILALQVDGTETFAFLIDEQNKAKFKPTTYKEVIGYFEEKERKAIEAEQARKERERQIALQEEQQRQREQKEQEEKEKEEQINKLSVEAMHLHDSFETSLLLPVIAIPFCFFLIWLIPTLLWLCPNIDFIINILFPGNTFTIFIILLAPVLTAFLLLSAIKRTQKWKTRRYIKKHPDDPRNPYLKEYL